MLSSPRSGPARPEPASHAQMGLFSSLPNRRALMQVMDSINATFGRGTCAWRRKASARSWHMKRVRISSPNYALGLAGGGV